MESGYEFDSFSELPPLPQVYHPTEYSSSSYPYAITPPESLPPFPYSDFTTYGGGFAFSDQHGAYSCLSLLNNDLLTESTRFEKLFSLDSSLSLLTRDLLPESTQSENLFSHGDVAPFLHLPDLHSIEHSTAAVEVRKSPCLSLAPPLPVTTTRHDVDAKRSTFTISPCSSSKSKSPARPSSSSHGGSRRRKISDKIRSLEKLMPWETKMSLATILEETHKYVTFLQSQIASLRWMPLESVYPTKPGETGNTNLLKSLTRQQILQVIANSPGSRNVLYTRGVCVFSYEQLLSVKMMAESTRRNL
ncbi:hypothetical protein N665_0639s0018 [Sinapis alba]|nr:hypothetical protein N665_0639s0018 [Sinapis alba]